MMVLAGVLLLGVAWVLLVLAVGRHHRALLGRDAAASRAVAFRLGGWMALAASLACFIDAIGWEQGPVFWTCALMLGGMSAALVLSAVPDRTSRRR